MQFPYGYASHNGFQLVALWRGSNDYRRRRQQLGLDRRRIAVGGGATCGGLLHWQSMDGCRDVYYFDFVSDSQTARL